MYNLTAGYSADNVTASVGIDYFCGAPTYNLVVYDQSGQLIPSQIFANVTRSSLAGLNYDNFELSIQTADI